MARDDPYVPDIPVPKNRPVPPPPGRLRRIVRWLWRGFLLFLIGSVAWVGIYRFVPPPVTFTMLANAMDGRGIAKSWMGIGRIDPAMARAAISAEDSGFCAHHGFDFGAMEAAIARNAQARRIRGGSTISQQTAKNVFLWQGRSYVRKAFEAWFTVLIELLWGKRRIMEVYLNVIETGIGTYGVNAGALRYFHHDASRLSATEAARIAAILPLPKKRAAIDPSGYTRRYGNRIAAREGVVARDALDRCIRTG
ncbi:MAG: monofunctional biosynthetic peptidoglycan transglycosylase [Sphingomonadaceae bacterium]|nr:monofunctional biosynthetic peptidoglycan transglycosylase [Sphingomonadaceae bacterium]